MIWLFVILAALILLALVWQRTRRQKADTAGKSLDELDTVAAWEPLPMRVLSAHERLAHSVLVRALPEYLILAQVPLSRFIKVPTRNSYAEWLQRVGNLCVDLAVCDRATQVLLVVEVRKATAPSERARARRARVERVLKGARIPLLRWTEGNLPTVDEAREVILQKIGVKDEAPDTVPAAVAAPAVGAYGAQGSRPSSSHLSPHADDQAAADEVIEIREPPPSTWFHDLEGEPGSADPQRRR